MNSKEKIVFETESAFAETMISRNFISFSSYLARDVICLMDGKTIRGKEPCLTMWEKHFTGENPPFTWKAETVAVQHNLAISTGPVFSP